jgi:hypothetical protein
MPRSGSKSLSLTTPPKNLCAACPAAKQKKKPVLNINHFYNLFKPSADIMSSYRRLKLICI